MYTKAIVAFTTILVIASVAVPASATSSELLQYFTSIQQADTSIFAASVVTQDTDRTMIDAGTGALGTTDRVALNFLDSAVRTNEMSEIFVATAILKLQEQNRLGSLDSQIDRSYLPNGVEMRNPQYSTTVMSLRNLLTHRSSLTDTRFEDFIRSSPTAVITLAEFCEEYFTQTTNGVSTVHPNIWSNSQPGEDGTFNYARANVALLAYIIERVVAANPTLVTGAPTALNYIQQYVLTPNAMSSTWALTLIGGNPTLSYPAGGDIFANKAVKDLTSDGTVTTIKLIHPAYAADYMYMSTAADLARLFRALFLDDTSAFATFGRQLRDANSFAVNAFTSSTASGEGILGQSKQGLALMEFNGATVCSYATSSGAVTKCPLSSTSNVWGFAAQGRQSMVGTLCTDAHSSTKPACTTVTISHTDNTAASMQYVLGMSAVALQVSVGDQSTVVTTTSSDEDNDLYGLWVFFGVIGIVVFVLVASYVTEYLIQPAPISQSVPMPTAMPGMSGVGGQDGFGMQ